ncbi:MAG TPA: sulfate ABC transporter permease subunit CysT [Longimicrobium sp.]|nr:sulfate ABC transporter permease subunit CysT [Longimicrobium sp.]
MSTIAIRRRKGVLPGFGLGMGITLAWLGLLVLIPLAGLFLRSATLSWADFWGTVSDPRAVAAYGVSFGAAFVAALLNVGFGLVLAWVLVRYDFPGRRLVDALVDLPFALPTAVAGITLTALFAKNGWLSAPLQKIGVDVAFTRLGIVIALVFIGLPFVVRTVQPVLEDLGPEREEAAASLGASRWQSVTGVVLPELTPALITGFALALARGAGEYGSVVFISGNLPMKTEIAPLLIVTKLEQYDYAGATAIAAVMLMISFALLLLVNLLQWWTDRRRAGI